jgi:LppM domain
MARRVGKAARVGAFVALALVLTGCIKLNMDLVINSDDTVSGVVQFGVQKELLELTGQSVDDLLGEVPLPSDAPGVTTEPFEDEEFAGQQFNFESVPIAQFNQTQVTGATGLTGVPATDTLSITRQGDTFVVVGVLDMSGGVTGATSPFGGTGAELLESADIRIAITFPGDVIEATGGQVDGNTVTYRPRFGDLLEINATGSAIDDGDAEAAGGDDGGSNLLLILIIVAIVAILAIVVFLVLRNRRGGGAGEAGFGEAPPPATPETATPPPGAPTDTPPPAPAPPMPPAAPPPPPAEG